tara:strand:- start:27563 stop:28303 length:741 start_codon:yes stop_codon:yes gene_type:complete
MIYPAKSNLCKSRGELHAIPITARGERSQRWEGINHGILADMLVKACQDNGMYIQKEDWQVNPEQSDMFASIQFQSRHVPQMPGIKSCIGLRHSNKSKYAITIVAGARVVVCQNGMFLGDHVLRQRHIGEFKKELPEMLKDALVQCSGRIQHELQDSINYMKREPINGPRYNQLLVEAGDRGVLPWSSLGKVHQEWNAPRHAEFEPRNAWSLYNAFTEVAKQGSACTQLRALERTRELLLPAHRLN